ncbi:cell division cycle 20.2, cofactor of APC complex-like [Cryptomeria japonica]|uniref:cell division cycle 20.2, cofactor of APC complex-like n=1 Tax=Cryptomeria japonica TaxID=3369 RepID=UPI0027DA476F|nr:cell division cycle 20.2, cofactor of APC complex-like [Cryptomeria japonica]
MERENLNFSATTVPLKISYYDGFCIQLSRISGIVRKYLFMAKIAELSCHTSRVLHLEQSPDGYTIASAGEYETLRFCQVFGSPDISESTKTKEPHVRLDLSSNSFELLHICDKSMLSSDVSNQYLHRIYEHFDAVTALAWCPFQHNLLASGGGLADQSIKLWNSFTGACPNTIEINSSVYALLWKKHELFRGSSLSIRTYEMQVKGLAGWGCAVEQQYCVL